MKIWQIPDGGIVGSLTDWIADLRGHMKKISYIEWHPTAANVLLSSAADFKVSVCTSPVRNVILFPDYIMASTV